MNNELQDYQNKLKKEEEKIHALEQQIKEMRKHQLQVEHQLRVANNKLDHIYRSDMYRISLKYYRIRDKIFAPDSFQYRFAKKCVKLFRFIRKDDGTQFKQAGNQIELLHKYGKYKRMDIVTTIHTRYVAELMKRCLDRVNIECEIHIGEPEEYQEIPYIIICPQFVKKFPKVYFAMQMEQTVSSRWFTPEYYQSLQNSCIILDYALSNVEFFHKPENKDVTSRVYYLPIDYYPGYASEDNDIDKEYDVVFYGDAKNERRAQILKELSKRFNVKICSELFGEDVYREIRKAKVLVNIHYYEDALLETTRLYETLSLNSCMVVSEDSQNNGEIDRLKDVVDFIKAGDVENLISRVAYWVEHNEEREAKLRENEKILNNRSNAFDFYFYRFLLAHDRIDFDTFYRLAGDYVQLNTNRLCLSLPESTERRRSFDEDNHYGFQCIPGLRHERGWVGCGLSYKLMFKKAVEARLNELMICEDDVIFPEDFEKRLEEIRVYLKSRDRWSVFSGVMADVGNVKIRSCSKQGDKTYAEIDHMISTVFNIYNNEMFDIFSSWNEQNRDVETNTIDRYLEGEDLSIFVQVPFLVGHKEELSSTIWGFGNIQYAEMIANSENKLKRLIDSYLNGRNQQ